MLKFSDRSVIKHVAEEKGHVIVINQDYSNPGKWEFAIYKDTANALGSDLLKSKNNIAWLYEAKRRAVAIFEQILKSNNWINV